MIALDTNIVLRYLMQDDTIQSPIATNLLEERLSVLAPGFISLVVVCELVWALSTTYRVVRSDLIDMLHAVIAAPELVVEHERFVAEALGTTNDVADVIIHYVGVKMGCTHTLTFDKKFARLGGVELLA